MTTNKYSVFLIIHLYSMLKYSDPDGSVLFKDVPSPSTGLGFTKFGLMRMKIM